MSARSSRAETTTRGGEQPYSARHGGSGGFILFDESATGSDWEVCRVVQEVAETGRYELVARNPNWFFRKK